MKRLLLAKWLLTGFLLTILVGCAQGLTSLDEIKRLEMPNEKPPQHTNLTALGIVGSIGPGGSVTGFLDDKGIDGWGDRDWYQLNGMSAGSPITVELSGSRSAHFGLAILKDDKWSSWNVDSNSNKRLNDTTGSTTWIWVGIGSGRGSYTLKINTIIKKEVCSRERLEASIPTPLIPYIQKVCYDNGVWPGAGAQLNLTFQGAANCRASFLFCDILARFIMSKSHALWRGDRTLESVTKEIWWHVDQRRPDEVINIQYMCKDLHWWEKPFYSC
jgi:hypothetical protein